MADDADTIAILERINRNLETLVGTNTRSFLGQAAIKNNETTNLNPVAKGVVGSFKALQSATISTSKATQHLSSSFEDASRNILHSLARLGEIGGVIALAIDSIMGMSKHYTELADVGQYFGGSMLEMAKLAGKAGLSLSDFSKSITKHGAVIANMNGVNAWISFQNGLRETLKDVGFFGMSLSELTDAGLDYADILRTTGRLHQISTSKLINEAVLFTQTVSELSAATGASRQEIIKAVTEAAKDPMRTLLNFTEQQQKNMDLLVVHLAAVGKQGQTGDLQRIMTNMLYDIKVGLNPLAGKAAEEFYKRGLPNQAAELEKIVEQMASGQMSSEDYDKALYNFSVHLKDYVARTGATLSDETKAWVGSLIQGELVSGTPAERMQKGLQASLEELRKTMDPLTKAMLTLPSQFEKLTGSFREGFYNGIMKGMGAPTLIKPPPVRERDEKGNLTAKSRAEIAAWEKETGLKAIPEPIAARDKSGNIQYDPTTKKPIITNQADIDKATKEYNDYVTKQDQAFLKFQDNLKVLGERIGTLVTDVFTAQHINAVMNFMDIVYNSVKWIFHRFEDLKNTFVKMGLSEGSSELLTGALAVGAYQLIKRGLSEFLSLNVNTKTVFVNGMPVGAGGPGVIEPGGTAGATPGKPGSRYQQMKTRIGTAMGGSMLFAGLSRTLIGITTGVFADKAFAALQEQYPNYPYHETISQYGGLVIGGIASLIGPIFISWIATSLLAAMATAITPAAVIAAIAAIAAVPLILNAKANQKTNEVAEKHGFTEAEFDDQGNPLNYINPATHEKKSAMAFDPRYAEAITPPTPSRPETPQEHDLKIKLEENKKQISDLKLAFENQAVVGNVTTKETNDWLAKINELTKQQTDIQTTLLTLQKKADDREEQKKWDAAK